MSVVKWTIYDPANGTSTFLFNPNAGGTPSYRKNFVYQNTSAADGGTIIFQGRSDPMPLDFSGTLFEQNQYDFLKSVYDAHNQVLLTDDLGRQFWILIQEFTPVRVRAAHAPWKHTYTIKSIVLDNPTEI